MKRGKRVADRLTFSMNVILRTFEVLPTFKVVRATRTTDVVQFSFSAHQSNVIDFGNARLVRFVVMPTFLIDTVWTMDGGNARDGRVCFLQRSFKSFDFVFYHGISDPSGFQGIDVFTLRRSARCLGMAVSVAGAAERPSCFALGKRFVHVRHGRFDNGHALVRLQNTYAGDKRGHVRARVNDKVGIGRFVGRVNNNSAFAIVRWFVNKIENRRRLYPMAVVVALPRP